MRFTVALVILVWVFMGFGAFISVTENYPEAVWGWVFIGVLLTIFLFGIYVICRLTKRLIFSVLCLTGIYRKPQEDTPENRTKRTAEINTIIVLPVDRQTEAVEKPDDNCTEAPLRLKEPATPAATVIADPARGNYLLKLQHGFQKNQIRPKCWSALKWVRIKGALAISMLIRELRSPNKYNQMQAEIARYRQRAEEELQRRREEADRIEQDFLKDVNLQQATGTRICPFCSESILSAAIKCKHCKSNLSVNSSPQIAFSEVPSNHTTASKNSGDKEEAKHANSGDKRQAIVKDQGNSIDQPARLPIVGKVVPHKDKVIGGGNLAKKKPRRKKRAQKLNMPDKFRAPQRKIAWIEIGDQVSYIELTFLECEKVIISLDRSEPERGIINSETPVARALLGKYKGDIAEVLLNRRGYLVEITKITKNVEDRNAFPKSHNHFSINVDSNNSGIYEGEATGEIWRDVAREGNRFNSGALYDNYGDESEP